MSLRNLARLLAPVAAVMLAAPAAATAQPITYTFEGTANAGFGLGTRDFTATFVGDASSALDIGALLGGPTGIAYVNQASSATLNVSGLGSFDLGSFFGGSFFVGALNGIPGLPSPYNNFDNGVGFFGFNGSAVTLAFYLPNNGMPQYGLDTSFGPITGNGYAYLGPISDPADFSFHNVIHVSNASFTAVSAVPEPSTYLLMATGLAGVAGAAIRRRRQTV